MKKAVDGDISKDKRLLIAKFIAISAKKGMLPKGKVEEAMLNFEISRATIFRFWKRVRNQMRLGLSIALLSRRGGISSHNKIKVDLSKLKAIPFHKRGTMGNVATVMGVSKSTIFRWKKFGVIRPHSNAIKPAFNETHMIARLLFSLKALSYDSSTCSPKFKSMTHVIHVDEKWFNMTQCTEKYYICPGEDEPHRSCQSKKFVVKVMFLCSVSRPIYKENGELLFDGKLGLWPFTRKETAKRNNKNRDAGSIVTKPLDSINREVTKEMMINHVLPAIKQKWPSTESKNIVIQWDNAPPHVSLHRDPDFIAAATEGGFNITLMFQPANSPDTNVNDLGWFRSIQSLQTDVQATNVDQLVYAVEHSFNRLSHITLNNVFLTLQTCLKSIMIVRGANNYKIQHMEKTALRRIGLLPNECSVGLQLVRECLLHLLDKGSSDELEGMMEEFS